MHDRSRLPRRTLLAGGLALGSGTLGLGGRPARAAEPSWSAFLAETAKEARRAGISPATARSALAKAEHLDRVIELDRQQPEGRVSFVDYITRVMAPARIQRGQALLEEHAELLNAVSTRFGIPPAVIMALWGVESSYGDHTGDWSVVSSVATLAYEGRRSEFFKGELIAALRILDAGDVTMDGFTGSWAGAMGQPQFMPSTYLSYAVDWDRDGRRDIWHSTPDIFASMANFLRRSGWHPGQAWGRPVQAPAGLADERRHTVDAWAAKGVRRIDGGALPKSSLKATLLRMDGPDGPAFLTYDNYRVFKIWNRSDYFALSVGQIADKLKTA